MHKFRYLIQPEPAIKQVRVHNKGTLRSDTSMGILYNQDLFDTELDAAEIALQVCLFNKSMLEQTERELHCHEKVLLEKSGIGLNFFQEIINKSK